MLSISLTHSLSLPVSVSEARRGIQTNLERKSIPVFKLSVPMLTRTQTLSCMTFRAGSQISSLKYCEPLSMPDECPPSNSLVITKRGGNGVAPAAKAINDTQTIESVTTVHKALLSGDPFCSVINTSISCCASLVHLQLTHSLSRALSALDRVRASGRAGLQACCHLDPRYSEGKEAEAVSQLSQWLILRITHLRCSQVRSLIWTGSSPSGSGSGSGSNALGSLVFEKGNTGTGPVLPIGGLF